MKGTDDMHTLCGFRRAAQSISPPNGSPDLLSRHNRRTVVLLARARHSIEMPMKTASVQQLPEQWPQILRWVAAGEEVEVTQQDKVIIAARA